MSYNFTNKLISISKWKPPNDWVKITTIDVHTEGEPLRVIINGFPDLKGETILARRRYAKENIDYLRRMLIWEPRGHADMYGVIITPPVTPQADFGVIFLHNEGYSTGCGHAIIGVTKVVLETGMFPIQAPETKIQIDTPGGLVTAYARIENNSVKSVYFHNVPSFVLIFDKTVDIPRLGKINYDLAFGGAFYAFVQVEEIGLEIIPENNRRFIEKGMAIKRALMKSQSIEHPFEKDLSFLYGTIFIGSPMTKGADSRNVCIFAEGEVDRCPTGTGVSARMAIHYARGEIGIGEPMIIESILGTRFTGRVVKPIEYGSYDAVIPEVEGSAYIISKNEFYIDPTDPLRTGFILR
ncbi:MAG: proline racemase family protein [Promethearchaeota archaeon]